MLSSSPLQSPHSPFGSPRLSHHPYHSPHLRSPILSSMKRRAAGPPGVVTPYTTVPGSSAGSDSGSQKACHSLSEREIAIPTSPKILRSNLSHSASSSIATPSVPSSNSSIQGVLSPPIQPPLETRPLALVANLAVESEGSSTSSAVTPATADSLNRSTTCSFATTTNRSGVSLTLSNEVTSSKRPKLEKAPPKVLSRDYSLCPMPDLLFLISDLLSALVAANDLIPLLSPADLTRFHSRAPPTISIVDYLQRLTHFASLEKSCLLSMVYHIDRLCMLYPVFNISSLTVHRFLITSATVVSKGLCDSFCTNGFYARVGGVSLQELNVLELEFLTRTNWRIVPVGGGDTLAKYYESLVERCDGFELEPLPMQIDSK